jgi:amino-acid N-acetyltransferase
LIIAELPSEGAASDSDLSLVVAELQNEVVGAAGVEVHGSFGLLRSVVVAEGVRGMGVGRALVADRLRWADDRALHALYLLTIDATEYFAGHGFRAIDRDQVPPEIRRSSEYESLCPESATVMVRSAADRTGELR